MEVTKTITHKHKVEFYPNCGDWQFGTFKERRQIFGQSLGELSKCFICEHNYDDDEKLIFITVSGKGNRFSCERCYEKQAARKESTNAE